MSAEVRIGPIAVGGGAPLALIAGPCVIESEAHTLRMAEAIAAVAARAGVPLIFKASFDKANRSSLSSFRGPGLAAGLAVLAKVRALGLPVLTDVHECAQVPAVAEVADCVQIPAFLCRQTDLLLAAGRSGRPVNIKKAQFLAPEDLRHAVDKVASTGNPAVLVTERGTSFGYHNLVVDFRGLAVMRGFGRPLVFDATHSVQLPGAAGASSGGQAEMIPVLARAAAAVGIDALFVEVHDRPGSALSDGANALDLAALERVLAQVVAIDSAVRPLLR